MFYYEARKKQLNYLIDKVVDYINSLNIDPNNIGFVIIIIHYLLIIFITTFLVFGKINNYYYFSFSVFLFSILINLYFNCCPVLKVERKLINEPNWAGLYEVLRLFNIEPNTKNIKTSFWSLCFILMAVVSFKKYLNTIFS